MDRDVHRRMLAPYQRIPAPAAGPRFVEIAITGLCDDRQVELTNLVHAPTSSIFTDAATGRYLRAQDQPTRSPRSDNEAISSAPCRLWKNPESSARVPSRQTPVPEATSLKALICAEVELFRIV